MRGRALSLWNRYDSQLAYNQRLAGSFAKDNGEILNNGVDFLKDVGGDLTFNYLGGKLLPEGATDIAGEIKDSVGDSSDQRAWGSLGHLTLATYFTVNYLRPTIYQGRNFAAIAKYGGGALLIGTITIQAYDHFGATIYNEAQQWSISRENGQMATGFADQASYQDSRANLLMKEYKAKGCDKL